MSRVLYIGDVHEPVAHPGYMSFCQDLRDKYGCTQTVFIGDVVDWHAISFHAHHPEAKGPSDEHELALVHVSRWHDAFPNAEVRKGNHDERLSRLAETVNIPSKFLRDYSDIWQTPTWKWTDEGVIDDVYSFHGTGSGGIHPAFNSMGKMLMSVVQGHIHSAAGIKWRVNPVRRIFGMDTGCGIDDKAVAFAYGQGNKVRSVLGAGVVIDGIPYHEVMPIGPNEKYHRSRFRQTRLSALGVKDDAKFAPENPAVPVSERSAQRVLSGQADQRRGDEDSSRRDRHQDGGSRSKGSSASGRQAGRRKASGRNRK